MDKKYIYWIITGTALVTASLVFEWFVPNMLAQRQADLLQQRTHKLTTLYSQQLPAWGEWSNIVSTILVEETVEKTVAERVSEKHETGVNPSAPAAISTEFFKFCELLSLCLVERTIHVQRLGTVCSISIV